MNKYLKKLLPLYQKLGFNMTDTGYEEPIPDFKDLESHDWEAASELPGLRLLDKTQPALLKTLARAYGKEFAELPQQETPGLQDYYVQNPAFGPADAFLYYGLIRKLKPSRVLEIGAGFSTFLAAKAVLKNQKQGKRCDLTVVDPYPGERLRSGFPGLGKLIQGEVQKLPLRTFTTLRKNDILFIDSSHVLKTGSDVGYEFLEILPRLAKGVWVHVHDIFLPYEYPKKLVTQDLKFYNEQYLLQAFLAFNPAFEVKWAGQAMFRNHFAAMDPFLKPYWNDSVRRKSLPWTSVSLWMRRK